MNDEIFKIKPTKSAVIEDDSKFLVFTESEIIQKLRILEKSKCIVTAYFDGGKQTLLTAIVDVLPTKKLVLLDYGPDDSVNHAILNEKHIIFKTSVNGVTVKFDVNKAQKATFKGESVFACQLPKDLLWVQRRDTYRVRVPMGMNAFCILYDGKTSKQYRIHDISVGGVALEDPETNTSFALGNKFEKCEITLPEFGTGQVDLEVRSIFPPPPDQPKSARKIGCLYHNLRSDVDAMIQRFIHSIDNQRRKIDDD
ncbi:MAG: flagellar brake protein [Gammaproteobacteria bacterium]|nr:flagellar brake protein [Gammaproteobacteria bacterium]